MTKTVITKAYIMRLYRLHIQIESSIRQTSGPYFFKDTDHMVAALDYLQTLAGELEGIFGEVLTEDERDLPVSNLIEILEEKANSNLGKDSDE